MCKGKRGVLGYREEDRILIDVYGTPMVVVVYLVQLQLEVKGKNYWKYHPRSRKQKAEKLQNSNVRLSHVCQCPSTFSGMSLDGDTHALVYCTAESLPYFAKLASRPKNRPVVVKRFDIEWI